jgi:iron complex outermembrane receptor protein
VRADPLLAACLASALLPSAAAAQAISETQQRRSQADAAPATPAQAEDVVVTGRRIPGSAIDDVQPLAVFDQDAIRAIGAPNLRALLDRLKSLTTSADGSDPVYLLNGRRISSLSELESLPPEAIERTEILPESEAARFGFSPTARVSNFITKKHFRALTLQELAGTATEGGGETNYAEINSTRIDGPRRLSVSMSYFRFNPLLQSERNLVQDPDDPFTIEGTVAGHQRCQHRSSA